MRFLLIFTALVSLVTPPALARNLNIEPMVISIVQSENMALGLHVRTERAFHGCFDIEPITYRLRQGGPILTITLNTPPLEKAANGDSANGQCGGEQKYAQTTIPLSATDIEKGYLKTIRLDNGLRNDTYDVQKTQNGYQLLPRKAPTFFKAAINGHGADGLVFTLP